MHRSKRTRYDSGVGLVATRPRAVTVSYSKGDDSKDQGDRAVIKAKLPKKPSMSARFLAHQDAANGFLVINRFVYLRQTVVDRWGLQAYDSSGVLMEFFTPRKFKDAVAVSFYTKSLTTNGFLTTATGINGIPSENVYVQKSSVSVSIINTTERS